MKLMVLFLLQMSMKGTCKVGLLSHRMVVALESIFHFLQFLLLTSTKEESPNSMASSIDKSSFMLLVLTGGSLSYDVNFLLTKYCLFLLQKGFDNLESDCCLFQEL